MKKIVSALTILLLVVSLTACAENAVQQETSNADTESNMESSLQESDPDVIESETDDNNTSSESGNDDDESAENKVLVAYFSATNTTKGLAEYVAEGLGADLYEIVPEQPYTDADLNYNDDNSRSTIEMNDPSVRPAISGSVENMEQYEIVFIGYPIWWGEAPRIISTFVESYDFSGKTVVPFCTSGGSGIGSSATNLEELTDGAQWLSGQRFSGGTSRKDMIEWVNGLGLDITAE